MEPVAERPFPPGDYPLVVVGSGPGALQVSYSLRRLGVEHAVLTADDRPGGMFLRFPFFQRLLSWTKPYAPVPRGTRAYERYDWNSLIGEEPAHRAIQAEVMDGSSEFPSRPEMEASLAEFVRRTALPIRYGVRWQATRAEGEGFVLETSDGEYRSRHVVFAVGVAKAFTPDLPGREHVAHYVETRAPETYAGRRLFIIGKQNSGFELASGLLSWASRIVLASPRPAKLSVQTNSLAGIRARYVQPFEDRFMGGGVFILDAAIDGVERVGDRACSCVRAPQTAAAASTWRRTRSSPRPASRRRCSTCLHSALRRSAESDCRPRHRTGRAPRCPTSTSPAPSRWARRASRRTASAAPARSTAPATTHASSRDTFAERHFGVVLPRERGRPEAVGRSPARGSLGRARAVEPEGLPGTGHHGRT